MKTRLILSADEGKVLTNGKETKHMVSLFDTLEIGDWIEVEDTEDILADEK